MDSKLIIANWKMNGDIRFIEDFMGFFSGLSIFNEVVMSVPFPYLMMMGNFIRGSGIKLGSQDISIFNGQGSFTGEVSGYILKDCFVDYVIVGHSERRNYFKEDSLILKRKLTNCFDSLLTPILCVGENIAHRDDLTYKEYILGQLDILRGLSVGDIIIAYEPIWAIGSGKSASLDEILDVHKFIFDILSGMDLGNFRIIYGGSVNEVNYKDILGMDYVDGVLVGGSSLDYNKFKSIVSYI